MRLLRVVSAIVLWLLTSGAASVAGDDAGRAAPGPARVRGLIELQRSATDHGTVGETTRTNLKFDYFLTDGPVSLLRLELPFPDHDTSFGGSPFDPALGDIKTRIGWRAIDVAGRPVASFLELTYPTADPASLGTGKYQLAGGVQTEFRLSAGPAWFGSPAQVFSIEVQQVVSFGGDSTRRDINETKFELAWRNTWNARHYANATAKPMVDWVGASQTGAVLELEGGWEVDRRWTLALLVGGRLWGEGVPGTYGTRVEIKVIHPY